MKSIALIVALATALAPGHALAATPQSAETPHAAPAVRMARYAGGLPAGSAVRLRLTDGRRLKGILMGVEGGSLVVKPRVRIPEPERLIPLASIDSIELDRGGMTGGQAALIGAATGAATFFSLILMLFAALGGD